MKNIKEENKVIYFEFVDTMSEYIMEQKNYTNYEDIVEESKKIAKILADNFDDVSEEAAHGFQAYAEMKLLQIRDKKSDPELFDADE